MLCKAPGHSQGGIERRGKNVNTRQLLFNACGQDAKPSDVGRRRVVETCNDEAGDDE
jgi:hypothetical protein